MARPADPAPCFGVRGFVLVGAVLLGILLMHGGLGVHAGASMMTAPKLDALGSADVGAAGLVATSQHGMARETDPGTIPPGVRARLTAPPSHDGHIGEMCLAVLRSVVLLAGLLLALLFVGVRGGEARPKPLMRSQGRLRYHPRPTGPLLSSLCVLRL